MLASTLSSSATTTAACVSSRAHARGASVRATNVTTKPRAAVVTMAKMTPKEAKRQQRHRKIRAKVSGTASRPRISVYRSNQHVYVQVIDDESQSTIAALGTMSKSVKAVIGEEEWKGKTVESAEQVGKMLGQMCVEKGITTAVFDRGGFLYHGRVKAVAEGARAAGVAM